MVRYEKSDQAGLRDNISNIDRYEICNVARLMHTISHTARLMRPNQASYGSTKVDRDWNMKIK